MCPNCGIKLSAEYMNDELDIYVCPICKDYYLILKGKLFKEFEKVSELTGKTSKELIIDGMMRLTKEDEQE